MISACVRQRATQLGQLKSKDKKYMCGTMKGTKNSTTLWTAIIGKAAYASIGGVGLYSTRAAADSMRFLGRSFKHSISIWLSVREMEHLKTLSKELFIHVDGGWGVGEGPGQEGCGVLCKLYGFGASII